MPPSSTPDRPIDPRLSQGLAAAGLGLFVMYCVGVAAVMVPLRLLDPTWQINFGGALINNAAIPLLGLIALGLAHYLYPGDASLRSLNANCRQWAVLAVLGFLLLVPLLSVATLKGLNQAQQQQHEQQKTVLRRYQQLRSAVLTATSSPNLRTKLATLNGPVLTEADQNRPLPELQQALLEGLIKAKTQMLSQAKAQTATPAQTFPLVLQLLRLDLTSLGLAFGFAGLANRPGSSQSLLSDWMSVVGSRRNRKSISSQERQQQKEERAEQRRQAMALRQQSASRQREIDQLRAEERQREQKAMAEDKRSRDEARRRRSD